MQQRLTLRPLRIPGSTYSPLWQLTHTQLFAHADFFMLLNSQFPEANASTENEN
jgi:hypothetical protein